MENGPSFWGAPAYDVGELWGCCKTAVTSEEARSRRTLGLSGELPWDKEQEAGSEIDQNSAGALKVGAGGAEKRERDCQLEVECVHEASGRSEMKPKIRKGSRIVREVHLPESSK
jgi:hypothetical protein